MEIEINGSRSVAGSTEDTVKLEKTLASIGALAAVSTVRKCFMKTSDSVARFEQHHNSDMDVSKKYLKKIS